MTVEETGIIMDILRTAYPRFYSGPDAPDQAQTLLLWAEMFAGDSVAMVAAAVKSFIAGYTRGFAPSIGQIKNQMVSLVNDGGMDEDAAWNRLRQAAANSGYGAGEEYKKLPEELQRFCSPGQLYEWSQLDSDVFNSVVASHFRKSFCAKRESQHREALLPPDVKRVLTGVSEHTALEEGNQGVLG